MPVKYRFSIVACARWETPYIVEWLNYYRAIGFDHVFLYCNDDDPTELFEAVLPFIVQDSPFVTFAHHARQGDQNGMYRRFLADYAKQTEWFSFVDVDEFIRLPFKTSVEQFLSRFDSKIDAVLINWVFFGPNGFKTAPTNGIVKNLTRRQLRLHPLTKALIRSSSLATDSDVKQVSHHPYWHAPASILKNNAKIVNVLGEDVHDYYVDFPNVATRFMQEEARQKQIFALAVIHHYAFRSENAFIERVKRGVSGDFAGQEQWKSLAESDNFVNFLNSLNETEDKSLADNWRNYVQSIFSEHVDEKPNSIDQVRSLFTNFQSIGNNCEFGSVKKQVGLAQLSLLQWSSTTIPMLINALRNDFAGFGEIHNLTYEIAHDEYFLIDRVYGFRGHTFIPRTSVEPDQFLKQQSQRIGLLKNKFTEDLEDGGFIFVFNLIGENISDTDQTSELAKLLCKKASNYLLVVTDQRSLNGSNDLVKWHSENVLYAVKDSKNTGNSVPAEYLPSWIAVCTQALAMICARDSAFANLVALRLRAEVDAEQAGTSTNPRNVALNKRATQSSLSPWSRGRTLTEDAAGAVDGNPLGIGKFHTNIDDRSWWMVDLESEFQIEEIRIFNRVDVTAVMSRASHIAIEVGEDLSRMIEVFRREDDKPFGGIDGTPLIFKPTDVLYGRFIRISLLQRNYLHLDQVEVFGNRATRILF
jgi:hypothetical protein